LAGTILEAVVMAAERHDLGKNRRGWQKAIGNARPCRDPGEWKPLAKSGGKGFDDSACGAYRHEFGSLREAAADPLVAGHAERDLILHLIAAHHGWARPHFKPEHGDIEGVAFGDNDALAADALRRFARLQRRFGRWGLAWLEAIMRAADYRVSRGRGAGARNAATERAA
jgi:CRISPR-associated endonuclease/helicase Cas3